MSLPAEPASAAVARRFVRDVLDAWGAEEFQDSAVLLTSELVTNALLHARSAPKLNVSLDEGRLRVAVSDDTAAAPVRKRYGKEAATGRGLLLVETIANAWGSEPGNGGKVVWFELIADDEAIDGESPEARIGSPSDRSDRSDRTAADRARHSPANRRRPPGGPRASALGQDTRLPRHTRA